MRYAPMLLHNGDRPFSNPEWLFEAKFDGWRAHVELHAGRLHIASRTGNDLTRRFRELAPIAQLGRDIVLDGEICVLLENGTSDFNAIARKRDLVCFVVFDVLELDGKPLVDEPLDARKQILATLIPTDTAQLRRSPELGYDAIALWPWIVAAGHEGLVGKRRDSRYVAGRSRSWIKLKTPQANAVQRRRAEIFGR